MDLLNGFLSLLAERKMPEKNWRFAEIRPDLVVITSLLELMIPAFD